MTANGMSQLPEHIEEGLSPNVKLVYNQLQAGRKITQLIAMTNLGVQSLTKRISELRALGLNIKDAWDKDHLGRRYKEYWIEGKRNT